MQGKLWLRATMTMRQKNQRNGLYGSGAGALYQQHECLCDVSSALRNAGAKSCLSVIFIVVKKFHQVQGEQ